jgi:hypothetical protein
MNPSAHNARKIAKQPNKKFAKKPVTKTAKQTVGPNADEDDDETFLTPEQREARTIALRLKLARGISVLLGNKQKRWRECRESACRRARACKAPHNRCSNAKPTRPMSERQSARTMAMVSRVFREVTERLDRERDDGARS